MKTSLISLYSTVALAFIMLIACGVQSGPTDFDVSNLLGTWKISEGAKTQIESWSVDGDGLRGKGIVLNTSDTIFVEDLAIQKINDKWTYTAQVYGQNENLPVRFNLENQSATMIAFANYSHDFPQRIVYELISENNLQVYIEGPRDGEKIRVVMDFKREGE